MTQQNDEGREAAQRAAAHASDAASAAGLAAGAAAEALGVVAGLAADRGREVGSQVVQVVRHRASDLPAPAALEGVVEEAFGRGAEAWDALRGRRTRPRRWPVAATSAVVGAALAVAGAVLARRLSTQDAPGAQEPEQVEAVVDLPPAAPATPPPGAAVDEDGEAVPPLG